MKRFLTGIVLLTLVSGCAVAVVKPLIPEVMQIANIEVRLYKTADDLRADLPGHVQAGYEGAERAFGVKITIRGWTDRINRRVYSIKNPCTIVHEFKHLLEPGWKHDEVQESCEAIKNPDRSVTLAGKIFPLRDDDTVKSVVVKLREFLK